MPPENFTYPLSHTGPFKILPIKNKNQNRFQFFVTQNLIADAKKKEVEEKEKTGFEKFSRNVKKPKFYVEFGHTLFLSLVL